MRSARMSRRWGLTFYEGNLLPKQYAGGAFIGEHGSWNRNPPRGYKVVFVPFADGRPDAAPLHSLIDALAVIAVGPSVEAAVPYRGQVVRHQVAVQREDRRM